MDSTKRDNVNWKDLIRVIPDFPKVGIQFVDWLPVMNDHKAFAQMIDDMAELAKDFKFNKIAGLESRGFLVGLPLAMKFGVDFIPIRKKGKLPGEVMSQSYELEYGTDSIEIQKDRISSEDSVLIVDDLIATSGTIIAADKLVSKFTDKIQNLFLIELSDLNGTSKLTCPYKSLLKK